jgi:hypothetical protein
MCFTLFFIPLLLFYVHHILIGDSVWIRIQEKTMLDYYRV